LDLFCGAGGAAVGYHRAGFDVVGVDVAWQLNYPFQYQRGHAVEVPDSLLLGYQPFGGRFAAVHASPPCQDYSRALSHMARGYPRLIEPVRKRLKALGLPYVIENVPGAPLPTQSTLDGAHGVELCGTMFGLSLWRHRLFEASLPVVAPRGCDHTVQPMNPHRGTRPGGRTKERDYNAAMGAEWMSRDEAREAIPPAYTEYIGARLMEHLKQAVA
jgi:DNA (cytosine-5)-methyltransferase 1